MIGLRADVDFQLCLPRDVTLGFFRAQVGFRVISTKGYQVVKDKGERERRDRMRKIMRKSEREKEKERERERERQRERERASGNPVPSGEPQTVYRSCTTPAQPLARMNPN